MANFNTLEEAQAEIIRLNEELTERTTERDTLSENNKKLTEENKSLHTLNQKYFNKLNAQFEQTDKNNDEEQEVVTCEDYAKNLNI